MSAASATLRLALRLGWRNLWRRPRRTATMLAAAALAAWSMVTLAAVARGEIEQMVERSILNLTGHVQVHALGYLDDPSVDRRLPAGLTGLEAALNGPDVKAWAPRVRVPAVLRSERDYAGVALVGIDPAREKGLSFIAGAVALGRGLLSRDDAGLLLGRRLAERLDTGLGRRVVLLSQGADGSVAERGFRVVGLFENQPEAAESGFVFTGLEPARRMLGMGGGVSEYSLLAADRSDLAPLVGRLSRSAPGLDVRPWTVLEPYLALGSRIMDAFLYIWFAVIFLTMAFGLVNTLLMAVYERTREIGLCQALGMPSSMVLDQVLAEAVFLILLGLALGDLAAWASLAWLGRGIDFSAFAKGYEAFGLGAVVYPRAVWTDFAASNAMVLGLGTAASLYPAWRASRRVPVETLTRV